MTRPGENQSSSGEAVRGRRTSVVFSLIFLLSLVVSLLGAVAVNILGNGTHLFPSPNFTASTCMRAWKARKLEQLAHSGRPPTTLVMGSSRVIPLEQRDVEDLTGEPAFNLGVSVGCPLDALAQLRLAIASGLHPRRILLGVDEFAFGDNPEADFYDMQLVTNSELFHQLSLRDRVPVVIQILKTINVPSTKASLGNLWRRWHGGDEPPAPADSALETMNLHEGDTLSAAERHARLVKGIDRLVVFWSKYLDRVDKVDGMRPTRRKLELFDEFLELASQEHIAVTVVLLPAHPEFERRVLTPEVRAIRDGLGAALAERCQRRGCVYRDYTDLASFGGDPEEFLDGTHMTPANGRLMLKALLAAPARRGVSGPTVGESAATSR